MGSKCTRGIAENVREELWGFFALSGLLFLNIGIVLVVYALKKALPYPVVLEVFGLGLIIMGILTTLASWYVHRQHRQKKPIFGCTLSCCKKPKEYIRKASAVNFRKTSRNNVYESSALLSRGIRTWKQNSVPGHPVTKFNTPEFQKYAEYTMRDTEGVEVNGTHKFKVESLRQKKHVHPHPGQGAPKAAMLVNAIYTEKGQVISRPMTVPSPVLLQFSS